MVKFMFLIVSNGFGVGLVIVESCSGNEMNNVRRFCNLKILCNVCIGVVLCSRLV